MKGLTPKRLKVLQLCARDTGYEAKGAGWQAIAWLRMVALVEPIEVGGFRRIGHYRATDAGRAALSPSPKGKGEEG